MTKVLRSHVPNVLPFKGALLLLCLLPAWGGCQNGERRCRSTVDRICPYTISTYVQHEESRFSHKWYNVLTLLSQGRVRMSGATESFLKREGWASSRRMYGGRWFRNDGLLAVFLRDEADAEVTWLFLARSEGEEGLRVVYDYPDPIPSAGIEYPERAASRHCDSAAPRPSPRREWWLWAREHFERMHSAGKSVVFRHGAESDPPPAWVRQGASGF